MAWYGRSRGSVKSSAKMFAGVHRFFGNNRKKTKQSNNQQIILDKKKTVTGILIPYKYDIRKHLIMQFTAELLICSQVF